MLKVNNKNSRTMSLTSFWCFYCSLGTHFTPFSSVPMVDFEQVNVASECVFELRDRRQISL